MQQVATYETVARACERLKGEGQKITGRSVAAITGGSLSTVLSYIKDWRQGAITAPSVMPSEIPVELQTSILRALGLAQEEAAASLKEEIDQASSREAEALEGLAEAENRIEKLIAELEKIQQQTAEERQTFETASAVSTEKIESMGTRVETLETERKQLIEAAESSRTEAAKAMLQVERADQATGKAEALVQKLETQLSAVQKEKISAEKAAAVAAQKNQDQAEILAETRAILSELKKDSREAISEQKREIQELRSSIKTLEKQNAILLAEKADIEKQHAILLVEKPEIAKSLPSGKGTVRKRQPKPKE